jgi:tight adherence protein C
MGPALYTFVAAFLAISAVGGAMFCRQVTLRRLARAVAPPPDVDVLVDVAAVRPAARVARFVAMFQRVVPRSQTEVSVVQARLARAGYREKSHLGIFYGAKVLVPLLLCLVFTVTGIYAFAGFFSYVMALGLGFLVPDFWLGNRIAARQTSLRLGLPDALDLIVICVEAGLGVDRAILRTTEELRLSQPEIADELTLVSLEQRAGRARADAWRNLGERTGVESIRTLSSILIQADKFGTSVGKALRAHADTLRTRRRQDAEEQAAKTTVKLIFPLVLFIFPALFVVTLGPSMIIIIEQMQDFAK